MCRHRIATRVDLPGIIEIYNSTIASRQVTADLVPVTVASRESWFNEHTADQRPLWIVEIDAQVVAWLSFSSFYGRPAYRHTAELSVYIRETHRKSGLASYLLDEAVAHAPRLRINVLLGFIFGHNEPSLRLFAKWGFVQWGMLPGVAMLEGVERDLIIVGRRVGEIDT